MGARHYLRVLRAYLSLHLKTAMEYRMNFFAQSGFMFLNDTMFVLIFYFLFSSFGTINGYSAQYALLVFGVTGLGFGILSLFFGNRRGLSTLVTEGGLDLYLSMPIDELFHALISKSAFDGVGDILFGIALIALFAPQSLLVGIIVAVLGSVVLLAFMLLIESLSFYLERPKNAIRSAHNVTIGLTSWPIDAFGGSARALLYIVPFAFVGAVPVHLIEGFSWPELGGLSLVAATMLLISILAWKAGIRRYESGNMMTVRT